MKVNTDGILLGAWAPVQNSENILDIGTGTGLIALMLAQRSQPSCAIDAIEIDRNAAEQARDNVQASPWPTKVNVINGDILVHGPLLTDYDLVVSNPPYFSDSLHSPSEQRTLARHNHLLSFESLLDVAFRRTSASAKLAVILPIEEAKRFVDLSNQFGWHLTQYDKVASVTGGKIIRHLLLFTKQVSDNVTTQLIDIRDKQGQFSSSFTKLCRDFYLKM